MNYDIDYKESSHRYKLDGIPAPGCTTITGILPKDWMPGWVAKEVVSAVLASFNGGLTKEQEAKIIECKKSWRVRAATAADHGTRAHSCFEQWILNRKLPEATESKEVLNAFTLFLRFTEENEIEWLENEVVVGSKEFMFCGKFDATAKVNGKVTLIDFKTSSDIFAEHYYQTAGYQLAYAEMEKKPGIEQRMILWVPKTGNEFKAEIVPTPYEMDRLLFLSALELYKRLGESERLLKELKPEKFKWK